ncbi:cleavage and polyadenylation specificity factor subunit 7 isoform X1 [Muntiacus reevesi]
MAEVTVRVTPAAGGGGTWGRERFARFGPSPDSPPPPPYSRGIFLALSILRARDLSSEAMSEGVDLIDIYADEEFNQDPEFNNTDQIDLYDDVLTATSQPSDDRSSSTEPPPPVRQEPSPKPNNKTPAILYTYSGLRNRRAAVYVGSFSWWTTDQQLIQVIRSIGVYDVVELKFAENRANGQSKGYAEVVVASENSVHKLLELLPGKVLNGEKVDVRPATRQNLSQFEAQARKRECVRVPRGGIPPRAHSRDSSDSADGRATPSENLVPSSARVDKPPSVLPYFNRPPSALPLMGLPPPPIPPPPPLSSSFGVPPPPPGIHYQHLMPPPPRLPPHLAVPPPGAIPPALHLNPAFFPPPNATVGPPPDTYMKASAPYNHHGSRDSGPPPSTVSEAEFEDIMKRNRAISSSAISKAVSGASAGDYSDAIETLLTAIAVIKQSRVANDERCRVLISSLKDCLHGIEAKSYSVGASGSSSRKRHRSRERSPSRSRESSRRHRDLLHNEDRHDDYFQERNREHERHRDRERDRHH